MSFEYLSSVTIMPHWNFLNVSNSWLRVLNEKENTKLDNNLKVRLCRLYNGNSTKTQFVFSRLLPSFILFERK